MRKLSLFIALALVALMLASCAKPEKVIYKDYFLTITRESPFLCVQDAVSGERYIFRLHRVKCSDSAVKRALTLLQTDNFTIRGVGGKMLIVEENGKKVYIVR